MTFTEAVSSVLRQYANFRGRAPRSEFWWFYLFTVLVSIVTGTLDGLLGTNSLIGAVASLALLVPWMAVSVRRLHDSDLSGWWLLPIVATSVIGGFMVAGSVVVLAMSLWGEGGGATDAEVSQMTGPAAVILVVGGLLLLAGFVGSLILGLRRSTPGPNRFGPPYGGGHGQDMPYGQHPGGYGYPPGPGYGTPPPGAGPVSTGYPPPGSSAYPPPPGSTYPHNPGSSTDHGDSPYRRPPEE